MKVNYRNVIEHCVEMGVTNTLEILGDKVTYTPSPGAARLDILLISEILSRLDDMLVFDEVSKNDNSN